MDLLRYDALSEEMVIDQIFPCVSDGKFESPLDFAHTGENLIQLYANNRITIFKLQNDTLLPVEFVLPGQTEATKIVINSNLSQLVAFKG